MPLSHPLPLRYSIHKNLDDNVENFSMNCYGLCIIIHKHKFKPFKKSQKHEKGKKLNCGMECR